MLFNQIIAVYTENYIKLNTYIQNEALLIVKADGTHSYRFTLNVNKIFHCTELNI
jgi:hypothetical protein